MLGRYLNVDQQVLAIEKLDERWELTAPVPVMLSFFTAFQDLFFIPLEKKREKCQQEKVGQVKRHLNELH
jgi:hypothetical protein